ncbi:MAG: LysE family transporter [Candidatus Saccharimonadales bacterium]
MKELLLVAGIHLLAVMSPGPDFAMVLRNSIVYSRRVGILAAIGLGLGILLHVTYSLLGIGLIISQSILLFNSIKLLGAAYLIYIGLRSLFAKKQDVTTEEVKKSRKDISDFAAIKLGFLTNALNPKATLFFLALFTQVINPETSMLLKAFYGLEMSVATFVWFSIVAVLLTHRRINKIFSGIKHHLEKVFGAVLIALGIKVALGAHK